MVWLSRMKGKTPPGPRKERARLVIVDDSELVRKGFRRMLVSEPDLEMVGEATNGREGVALCRRLRPDLVLMDVRMPGMDGLEATREIKREQPETSILIVTSYENPDYLLAALKAGASGYILKDAPRSQLINAIRRVLDGDSPINQELAARLISSMSVGARRPTEEPYPPAPTECGEKSPLEELTPREHEVLQLLAQGKSNPQIAQHLGISRGTAKTHVQHIIHKLEASDRTQAVVRAIDLGLLSPESD